MLANPGGDSVGTDAYEIVAQNSTYRLNTNNTTTPIEQITARSLKYPVEFTFNVTKQTYDNNGAPVLASEKTAQVNEIAGVTHVIGVRGEEDQGPDGNLYNYLVVTVGTPDGTRQQDVRIRMDQIGTVGAFAAIDQAWTLMNDLGPTASQGV